MVSAFVLTSSYSGSLRAVLVTPTLTPPIDTIRQLIHSDLDWSIVSYDDPIEQQIAASRDPDIMEFWAKKGVVEYQSFYYEKVNQCISLWHITISPPNHVFRLFTGVSLVYSTKITLYSTSDSLAKSPA